MTTPAVAAFVNGDLLLGALSDDELGRVPLDALAERLLAGPHQGATPLGKLLAVHPGLASPEPKLALLERLHREPFGGREHTLSTLLVHALEAAAHAPRVAVFARLAPIARADLRAALVAALVRAEHGPTLERLASELDAAIASRRPTWTTGHATKWLVPHVQAIFLVARERAMDRFAPYFAAEALADDDRAQIAATILAVGVGYVTHHQVVVRTSAPAGPALDPRFWAVAASLASHRKLGRVAKQALAALPKAERDARLGEAALASPAPAVRARKAKARAVAYAVGDRVRVFWDEEDALGSPGTIETLTGDYARVRDDVDGLSGVLHTGQMAPLGA
jgi:hypothetical protein